MPTHFLDTTGRIKDLEAIIKEQEADLYCAERAGNSREAARIKEYIQKLKNEIQGMKAYLKQ